MFKCLVHMYGLPHEITDLRAVEIEVDEGVGMADVVAAMKKKIPSLEGPIIRVGEDRLEEAYKFNLNGTFYFDGMDFQLKPGDRIALLTPATGG
jgi:molybdopterin converting factor small subunit